ncbi:hypothetical protein A4R43_04090 [Amycolatopsis albispora]|uniref:Uncharacterized protein n=1 Tax=Amycolatopsis albispora TaxID=1804986 RepID=A0A344L183_9PSEU|nr:hypothetical protein A4R43_04090 [Amycolatopsis albispora]
MIKVTKLSRTSTPRTTALAVANPHQFIESGLGPVATAAKLHDLPFRRIGDDSLENGARAGGDITGKRRRDGSVPGQLGGFIAETGVGEGIQIQIHVGLHLTTELLAHQHVQCYVGTELVEGAGLVSSLQQPSLAIDAHIRSHCLFDGCVF